MADDTDPQYQAFLHDLGELSRDGDPNSPRLRELYSAWRAAEGLLGPDGAEDESAALGRALEPKARFGPFELVRAIARGGQGSVWEAQDTKLDRRVALKIVLPDRVNEATIERFAREAKAGGRLAHPGIVSVYSSGETDGLHWIALELVPGGRTLRDWIEERRRMPELPASHYTEAAEIVASIADALHVAHEAGVIHRDVKPLNILLASDGRPRLTDFGMARLEDGEGLSATGDVIGTYAYMSPEQLSGRSAEVDPRADVFSLGIVLYELLVLRRPFDGDTTQQILLQILREDPPAPSSVRSRVPNELALITGMALEKEPARRYPSARDFAADLRRQLAHEPIRAVPPSRLQ